MKKKVLYLGQDDLSDALFLISAVKPGAKKEKPTTLYQLLDRLSEELGFELKSDSNRVKLKFDSKRESWQDYPKNIFKGVDLIVANTHYGYDGREFSPYSYLSLLQEKDPPIPTFYVAVTDEMKEYADSIIYPYKRIFNGQHKTFPTDNINDAQFRSEFLNALKEALKIKT